MRMSLIQSHQAHCILTSIKTFLKIVKLIQIPTL